jgi:hypothetical protein
MSDQVLFAGPWVQMTGWRPTRIVLHASFKDGVPQEYVVHCQFSDEAGRLHYENGDYFPGYYENSLERAISRFGDRCKTHYHQGRKFLTGGIPGFPE